MGRVETKKNAPSESTSTVVARILNDCQHSHGLHARRVKELVAWRSNHRENFLTDFWKCVLPVFTIFKREPAIERLVKFVVAFVAYRDEKHGNECDAFLEEFFGILLFSTDAPNKAVRLRACQILSEVILRLEENAEVSNEVWDDVIECMQKRIQDKIPAIRVYSARALARFANVDGSGDCEDDAVISAYRKALQFDQNAEVRRNIILSMPPSNATVPDIVKHTADVSEAVRRSAFIVLAKKFPLQSLSIKQRASILHRGLHDRKVSVQTECLKMLKDVWLAGCCQGDAIGLLKYLDVETHETVGESVMLALLKANLIPLQDDQSFRTFMPSNDAVTEQDGKQVQLMEAEEALYWRMIISYLHSEAQAKGHDAATTGGAQAVVNAAAATEKIELLERVLPPTMGDYVDLVKAHLNAGPHLHFVSRQLLLLGKFLDFSDATNQKIAGAFLQDLLRRPAELGHFEYEQDNEVLIGDGLSLGGDKHWAQAVAELTWKVYGAQGEFEKVVSEAVADLGRPCREGGADIMQWVNCLAVTGLLLENLKSLHQLPGHTIEAQEILNGLLLPAAKHIHSEVQRAAVRCLGLFCIRDHKPSPQAVKQLRLALTNSTATVQKMASKALFDLCMWHGAAMIDKAVGIGTDLGPIPIPRAPGIGDQGGIADDPTAEGDTWLPLLELLAQKLDADDTEQGGVEEGGAGATETVKSIVAEGFAKLLLQSKVFSDILPMQHSVLAKLLRLYFDEESKGVPRLRQCLSVFWEIYPSVDLEHKRCISKAFIPVMRSEWSGLYENQSGSSAAVAAKKRRATTVSKFLLQLLHQPMLKGASQCDAQLDGEGESIEQENCTRDEAKAAHVWDEELAIRIAAEVTGFPSKRTPAAKSYLAMLSKTVCGLEFRQSEQDSIKCMRTLLDYMKDSVTGDRQATKELESLALRLKALDNNADDGLSDEQLRTILSNMELQDPRAEQSHQQEIQSETVTPAPANRNGRGRRRVKKAVTPESPSPPNVITPIPASSVRTLRASKTAAIGKMRSEIAPSKRALYASSDEELVSSSSPEEAHETDSEFEADLQEQGSEKLREGDDGSGKETQADSGVTESKREHKMEEEVSSEAQVARRKARRKQSAAKEVLGDPCVVMQEEHDESTLSATASQESSSIAKPSAAKKAAPRSRRNLKLRRECAETIPAELTTTL